MRRTHFSRLTKIELMLVVLIGIFLISIAAIAAEESEDEAEEQQGEEVTVSSEDAHLKEVVVTATRTEHSVEDSPVSVELVDEAQIDASGAKDAGDAIGSVSGVFVDDYESASRGGPGSGVNLHGLPTDRILVLIDGQRVPKTMRAPDLEIIPSNIIKRVEVVKGPSSALYGSDAVGGVINIITRDPNKEKIELEAESGYGSFNTYRGNLLHSATFGPIGYLIAFNHENSDGWMDDFTQKMLIEIGRGPNGFTRIRNDEDHPYWLNDLFGKWRLELGPKVEWRGQGRYHWEGNTFGDEDGGVVDDDKTRLDTQTGVTVNLGAGGTLAINGYFFRHTFRYRQYESVYVFDMFDSTKINRSYIDKGNDTFSSTYRSEAVYNVALGGMNLLTAGLDFRYETLDYEAFEFSQLTDEDQIYDAYQTVTSAFLQDEIFLLDERLTLVPGIRVDQHVEWGTVVNPKFSTLGKLVVSDPYGLNLRASVGRAFKEPSLSQLYRSEFRHTGYYLTGNEDLEPESAIGWNVEVQQIFARKADWKIAYFQYEIDDMIWTDVIDPSYFGGFPLMAYRNVKQARTYGGETSLRYSPHKYLALQGQYTYTKTMDLEENKDLGTVAGHQAAGQIFVDILPWDFGGYLFAGYTSERDYIGMGGLWYTAEPRWTTKARIYKRFLKHMELFLEANNLIDQEWDREGDGDNDLPPINLFGGIKAWL